MRAFAHACVVGLIAIAAGCGDNLSRESSFDAPPPPTPDAPPPDDDCGDGMPDEGEACDNGTAGPDLVCDDECRFECGNGELVTGEACDDSVAGSECPTSCDDAEACTSDVLGGSGCQAACVFSPITVNQDGDGCCVAGATSLDDADCPVVCGNGVVEAGETCDTDITSGPGSCPATCDDAIACTTDTLVGAGTCVAACTATPITAPANNDDCCPPGANTGNDNDCVAGCGNAVVDPGETCDTAIPSGAGSCPTTCTDGMACTTDVLSNSGTCTAVCAFPPITAPANGDGCCPTGANANIDTDCPAVCGNGIVEPGEQCDNTTPACAACMNVVVPTAYRFTDVDVREPHLFVELLGCHDATDTPVFGVFAVNTELATALTTDDDGDGLLDLSPVNVFRPLNQTNGAMTPLEVYTDAECTAPAGASCSPAAGEDPVMVTATNQASGTCLQPVSGTLHPYTPAVTNSSAPCFSSTAATVTFTLSGIPITLTGAQIGATYVGNPATGEINGLLRGFISEADADATILPDDLPLVGGEPLSSLLPGGDGNCAAHDDRDVVSGVTGWWFYLNFTATRVTTWTE
jgi:hypothetical protein